MFSYRILALVLPLVAGAAEIVRYFDGPDTGVTGLACTQSELFAVTGPSHTMYRLDTETGAVLSSWNVTLSNPAGLASAAGSLVVTNGTWIVHTYSTSGALLNASTVFTPGWYGVYSPESVIGAAGNSESVFFYAYGQRRVLETAAPMPDSALSDTYNHLSGMWSFYDLAWEGTANGQGDIWASCSDPSAPIRAYDISGSPVNSLDIIPSARGLAFFSSAGQSYLWASCPTDGRIYLISLDGTGVEEEAWGPLGAALAASSNPFDGVTTLSGTGFSSEATLEIFDMTGRRILGTAFQGTYTWLDEDLPPGAYAAMANDLDGRSARLTLIKL